MHPTPIQPDIAPANTPESVIRDLQTQLAQRDQQLTNVMHTWDALRLTSDLDSLFAKIVQAAHNTLGFQTVVLNLVEEAANVMRVRAHAGLDAEGQAVLDSAIYVWSDFAKLLDARFQTGRCYFVPAGTLGGAHSFGGPIYIPDLAAPAADQHDAWHPEDFLMAAIELRDGRVVGLLNVDLPHDGRRPTRATLQLLEIFSAQAAIAIENAQMYAQMQAEAARYRAIALATPLIPISATTVVLPLIGALDAARARQIGEDLLRGVTAQRVRTVILDLTGVPTLDRPAAAEIAQLIQATHLLGARVALTGVRPLLAQALVQVDAPLQSVRTYATLQQGIATVLGSFSSQ